jgi:hypothetical protein
MGARPSGFKTGKGFLNGVEGTIVGYEFTDDMFVEGGGREPFKPGKVKGKDGKLKDRFHSLNFILQVLVDGAETPITQALFAGGADDWSISEGGLEIFDAQYPDADVAEEAEIADPKNARQLGANTGFAIFLSSLVEAGFPAQNLPETRANFEAIIGTRCRFVQREDPNMKGQKRKAKNGKEYNYTNTVVDDVLGLPETTETPAATVTKAAPVAKTATVATKTAPAAKAAAPKAKAAKATAEPTVDVKGITTSSLFAITRAEGTLNEEEGSYTIPVAKYNMAILKLLTGKVDADTRSAARTMIADPSYLKLEEGWAYDAAAKTVTVPAEEVSA